MVPGNYLPPFTADERATIAGTEEPPSAAGSVDERADEVTYADFLGDQVDDDPDH